MQIINRFPEEKEEKKTKIIMESMWKLFWSRQRPWVRGMTQETAERTKVQTSNRLCVCVCVFSHCRLYTQSFMLSLLMPEVALYDEWDQ